MVATAGVLPVFVAVKAEILPVPLAARPIEVLSFVHEYEVPVPEKVTVVVDVPLQTNWSVGSLTVGVGFTVT